MKTRSCIIGLLLASTVLPGCGGGRDSVAIGSKDFVEQAILAEMAAGLLREAGVPVSRIKTATDSYQAQANLREGAVDLMAEYSGTALNLIGGEAPGGEAGSSIEAARHAYGPLGLRWLGPLGFDNGYAVLVPSGRASALGLASIDDLSDPGKFPGGIRVACPPEFLRRPGDGLGPLVEAYGIRLSSPPAVIPDVLDRMRALEGGRVDVAIGVGTDGVIPGLGLRVLDDPKGFFPPYEAAFVVRDEALRRWPAIEGALAPLSGRLDAEAMRALNARVEIQGRRPAIVAREFLVDRGLLPAEPEGGLVSTSTELALAIDRRDDFGDLEAEAVVAARSAFPDRPVSSTRVDDPAEAVARGDARMALMGAERFFPGLIDGGPDRETRVEAAAVVGFRLVHLVRRLGDGAEDPLSGRVGVPPEGSGSGAIARRILGRGREPELAGTDRELVEAVRRGGLDAAIVLAPAGEVPGLSRRSGDGPPLGLRPLPGWLTPGRAVRMPFLRPARIAAGSYAGQDGPVETLGVQVLLAGPSRRAVPLTANSGPASALTIAGLPLDPEEVEALAVATGVPEAPDPTLPSSWGRRPAEADDEDSTAAAILSTALNVLAIAFVAWVVRLAMQPPGPRAPGDRPAPGEGDRTSSEPA
ncbi:glycine betaine ABC transporter substrate-binding protein [Tautonia plasticadhaerens]|uniref:Glycine betaine/carnitine/choline-binding protein OpuCC n=1 Tax=Tautonia plasticadhaerens TaxID=2527974 RepID=A0A518HCD6_9BACT|nr:glycine betaine ABC transporter substrate-binding protein [Tautonia plasticadhaerens]QDV38509.1 Glycine betaine/carnitine/choline-binding protein OpuCC precursor [Tautonia plasticadhaerens]